MTKKWPEKIFGTDGVRGRANVAPMTVEIALALGRAAGKIFRTHNGKRRVVIGKDTRLSCYMFENALISGLCSMGVDTLMVGPLPTPGDGARTPARPPAPGRTRATIPRTGAGHAKRAGRECRTSALADLRT